MKKLISLEEHNKACLAFYPKMRGRSKPNGIACPQCGEELFDTAPMITIKTVYPPQLQIHCRKCGYSNTRIEG